MALPDATKARPAAAEARDRPASASARARQDDAAEMPAISRSLSQEGAEALPSKGAAELLVEVLQTPERRSSSKAYSGEQAPQASQSELRQEPAQPIEGADAGAAADVTKRAKGGRSDAAGGANSSSSVPSSVIVAVRARPLAKPDGTAGLWVQPPATVTISPGKSETQFIFDYAYGSECTQEQIYRDVGAPILRKGMQGFNATIFAYGQTGSGKSHTMMGITEDPGIIPRMSEELFFCVDKALADDPKKKFLLMVSYMEIYNEALQDLLAAPSRRQSSKEVTNLEIREHQTLGVYVKGLLELPVRSRSDVLRLMAEGNARRATGETNMNARSSRSHSIFTLRIQQQEELPDSDQKREVWSRINLVDLAGSERAAKTGAEGQRLKEGININQSLSALGAVITALAESARKGKMQFIPYRNSKLTRVLQESLGGNSLTVMIANVSSEASNMDESHNTLLYADRAKAIQVKATKNEQMSEVCKLREEVDALRRKLADQAGVEQTDEEEQQMQHYRRQIEEYELRLQQSFEEKARACSELERKVQQHSLRISRQRESQREQAARDGNWLQALAVECPVWVTDGFLDSMVAVQGQQRDAELHADHSRSFIEVLLELLEEAVAQLEWSTSWSSPRGKDVFARTIDLSSTEGGRVLRDLASGMPGRLQLCRQLLLRWQSLADRLEQSSASRKKCIELHEEAQKLLKDRVSIFSKKMAKGGGTTVCSEDDLAEAKLDCDCAVTCLEQKATEMQQGVLPKLEHVCAALRKVLIPALRSESEALSAAPSADGLHGIDESEGLRQQRQQRAQEAADAAAALDRLNCSELLERASKAGGALPKAIAAAIPEGIQSLERCGGQRLLQQRRASSLSSIAPTEAAVAAPNEMSEETRQELETLREQHKQLLAVVACQATTIEQVTAGSGNASAREVEQQQALASQAKQLGDLHKELVALRQSQGTKPEAPRKGAATSEHELFLQSQLEEVNFQQAKQLQLSEQMMEEHATDIRLLRGRLDSAEKCNVVLENQIKQLKEDIAGYQKQLEQQGADLLQAQAVEQQFAKLAAEMGCVDEQGQLMRKQLEEVTAELIKTKVSEAEYQEWFQDVKRMLASGKEDGLAMALAQNMVESRKKDDIIRKKDAEIRQLRANRMSGRPSSPMEMLPSGALLSEITSGVGAHGPPRPRGGRPLTPSAERAKAVIKETTAKPASAATTGAEAPAPPMAAWSTTAAPSRSTSRGAGGARSDSTGRRPPPSAPKAASVGTAQAASAAPLGGPVARSAGQPRKKHVSDIVRELGD